MATDTAGRSFFRGFDSLCRGPQTGSSTFVQGRYPLSAEATSGEIRKLHAFRTDLESHPGLHGRKTRNRETGYCPERRFHPEGRFEQGLSGGTDGQGPAVPEVQARKAPRTMADARRGTPIGQLPPRLIWLPSSAWRSIQEGGSPNSSVSTGGTWRLRKVVSGSGTPRTERIERCAFATGHKRPWPHLVRLSQDRSSRFGESP